MTLIQYHLGKIKVHFVGSMLVMRTQLVDQVTLSLIKALVIISSCALCSYSKLIYRPHSNVDAAQIRIK